MQNFCRSKHLSKMYQMSKSRTPAKNYKMKKNNHMKEKKEHFAAIFSFRSDIFIVELPDVLDSVSQHRSTYLL